MRIKNRYQSRLTLVVVLSLVIIGTAKAQSSSDISSDSLFQPDLIRYLKEGRIDAFQTSDVAGVFYAHGVYMRGIGRCPKLKTTDIPLSEIYILRDIKNFIRLFAFDPTGDPVSRARTSMRASSFLGQGIADIDVIIANSSCQAQYTRAVIGAAETINVERVKQMRKDQARRQQDRRRADAARRTERERKAFYEQKLREGQVLLLADYNKEYNECKEKYPYAGRANSRHDECIGEASQRLKHGRHELDTGLEYSRAHTYVVRVLVEYYGRTTGLADACMNVQVAKPRAEIGALQLKYFPEHETSLLDLYDAAYDAAYQYGLQYFKPHGVPGCREDLRERYEHLGNKDIEEQIEQWRRAFHGRANHRPHSS